MTDVDQRSVAECGDVVESWAWDTPLPMAAGTERLTFVLESPRGLSAVRRQVRAFLTSGWKDGSAGSGEDTVERAVLVIDELTSNALRHGLPPWSLQIIDEPRRWLVIVRDAAPERLPVPAIDRPAGAGGYGLYIIVDLTGAHYEADHELVRSNGGVRRQTSADTTAS